MPNLKRILERTFRDAPTRDRVFERRAYGRAYLFAAWRAFDAGDLSESAGLLRRAFRHSPELVSKRNSLTLGFELARAPWANRSPLKES